MNLLDAALRYAKLGWKIFPCSPGQKTPATKHGVKDATSDESQIREWWTRTPNANIAVACGEPSGVYVVDVDVDRKRGIDGWNTLAQLAQEGKVLPKTVKSRTPRGGAHYFFRADDPPANKNSFMPGIDIRGTGYYVVLAPSVHPNGNAYHWNSSWAPWDCQPAVFPDFMRPAPKPISFQGTQVHYVTQLDGSDSEVYVRPFRESEKPADSDVLRRASAYLATCDPAVQGQAGHDKLLWAAVAMVHGFLLSDSQAYDLLAREYNPRCEPPWDLSISKDEKDFRRKVTEARKLAPKHPPGWLLDEGLAADASRLDIPALIRSAKKAKETIHLLAHPEIVAPPARELEFLVRPPGLVGDICAWINCTAMKPQPFLTLGATLAFCGALFGRKVEDHLGTRTNLYCMGLAKSSAGKNHAMRQIRRLAIEAGCLDLLGGDDFASDASIEARLEKNPATLFLCDEIGHLLHALKNNASPYTAKIVSLLMKLYSAADSVYKSREYADTDRRRTLIQPCCCIYGVSYPEKFFEALSPEELQNGWLSRCLVFHTDDDPPKNYNAYNKNIPEDITQKVHAWFARKIEPQAREGNVDTLLNHYDTECTARPPTQLLVPVQGEAEFSFRNFNEYATEIAKNSDLACLWHKGEENARRIGLILACGENFDDPVITPSIADYACRLVSYLLSDFSARVPAIVSNITAQKKQKLLAIMEKAGIGGCGKRELARKTQWSNQMERKILVGDLLEAELAVKETIGRKTIYWTVENYLAYRLRQEK